MVDTLSFGLALVAGLVSFLSPCVLSLVPVYLGYLGSRAVTPGGAAMASRWDTFSHGLAFVLGFSAVFVVLGITATAIGDFAKVPRVQRGAGVAHNAADGVSSLRNAQCDNGRLVEEQVCSFSESRMGNAARRASGKLVQ